jgi:hypothetical protein
MMSTFVTSKEEALIYINGATSNTERALRKAEMFAIMYGRSTPLPGLDRNDNQHDNDNGA